jgi:hypothetical protein
MPFMFVEAMSEQYAALARDIARREERALVWDAQLSLPSLWSNTFVVPPTPAPPMQLSLFELSPPIRPTRTRRQNAAQTAQNIEVARPTPRRNRTRQAATPIAANPPGVGHQYAVGCPCEPCYHRSRSIMRRWATDTPAASRYIHLDWSTLDRSTAPLFRASVEAQNGENAILTRERLEEMRANRTERRPGIGRRWLYTTDFDGPRCPPEIDSPTLPEPNREG